MAGTSSRAANRPGFSPGGDTQPDPTTLMIAEHLASIGTLVAGVAHEINNPITYVLGNLKELEQLSGAMRSALQVYRDRLSECLGDAAETEIADIESKIEAAGGVELLDELIEDASEGAVRIRDLVRDLLSLSRGSERSTAPMPIEEVLDSTLRLVSRPLSARAELVREYRASRLIEADRAKLGQVFLNLINNAIDACPDGDESRIVVRTSDTPDGVRVEFEDSGPGIPEAIRPQVFAPFFSTKEPGEGTGIGLYISQRIVDDHGGSIGISESACGGTIIWVELPETPEPTRHGDSNGNP